MVEAHKEQAKHFRTLNKQYRKCIEILLKNYPTLDKFKWDKYVKKYRCVVYLASGYDIYYLSRKEYHLLKEYTTK